MERDIKDSASQVTNDELDACNSKNNDDEEPVPCDAFWD